jgi:hypothetical protein
MNRMMWTSLLLLPVALFLSGCGGHSPNHSVGASADDADIRANLAKLNAEDRQLAEAQKFCAVEKENRLGEMGEPFKVMVKGEPVFLCCKGCRKQALADPEKTLAAVETLKKTP